MRSRDLEVESPERRRVNWLRYLPASSRVFLRFLGPFLPFRR